MKTITKTIAAAVIAGASITSAHAFWGPWSSSGAPWNTWTDMFGDVDANFSSRGWGRGYGYGYPHYGYGYGPYGWGAPGYGFPGYYGAPVAAPVAVAPAAPVAQAK